MHYFAKIALSSFRPATVTEKVLGYMMEYNDHGHYYASHGKTSLLLGRLKISRKDYHRATKRLVNSGAMTKRKNGNGSQYCFYELSKECKRVLLMKDAIASLLETNE